MSGNQLGDLHNFGRATTRLEDGRILKPRPIFWEKSVLSPNGSLRNELETVLTKAGLNHAWSTFPSFFHEDQQPFGAIVTPLNLAPAAEIQPNKDHFQSLGATMATCLFLGATDLHKDNVVFGARNKKLVFGPIDLESIFASIDGIHSTSLVPDSNLKPSFAGLASVKAWLLRHNYENAVEEICKGFLQTIESYATSEISFDQFAKSNPDAETQPIRVVLRSTDTYSKLISGELAFRNLEIPLMPEEFQQIRRKDVPYFFRTIRDKELYWFADKALTGAPLKPSWSLKHLSPSDWPRPLKSLNYSKEKAQQWSRDLWIFLNQEV